jgi:DNA-binding response OmpR family regulator
MSRTKGRILCVDDDADTREMMTALLGVAGYEVHAANGVAEGMASAKSGKFDLIILDWFFQDGTGIELCKMIRTSHVGVPILFYSGMAHSGEADDALRAGAQAFLVKPVNFDDLLQNVSHLVGN